MSHRIYQATLGQQIGENRWNISFIGVGDLAANIETWNTATTAAIQAAANDPTIAGNQPSLDLVTAIATPVLGLYLSGRQISISDIAVVIDPDVVDNSAKFKALLDRIILARAGGN